jgi:hypothetical protein
MKDNVWHHIAFTRDNSARTIKGYIDGVWDGSNPSAWVSTVAGSNNWIIGDGYVNNFRGVIDEVRIYERALGSAEIQQHYADGAENHQLAISD